MSSSKPIGVRRVNRRTRNPDQYLETCSFEALTFSWHNIDLVIDEEEMHQKDSQRYPKTQVLMVPGINSRR